MRVGIAWLVAGLWVGLVSAWALAATVDGLMARPRTGVPRRLATGALLRWGLAATLLVAALRRGLGAALWASAGLWLARWAALLWWSRSGSGNGGRLWK